MTREGIASVVFPVLLVAALALLQQWNVFRDVDGRLFDLSTGLERGRDPAVVVVERDTVFESSGPTRFGKLDNALARLGVERIGYLDDRPLPTSETAVPILVGAAARRIPGTDAWTMILPPGTQDSGSLFAARILAPSEYGIYRSQSTVLPGLDGSIPVFDAALAGTPHRDRRFLVRMPARQSIPVISASQLVAGELIRGELSRTVALVAASDSLKGTLSTPLAPGTRATSEAIFRAHAIQDLRAGRSASRARAWEAWLLLGVVGLLLVIAFRRTDPKRLAIVVPVAANVLVLGTSWLALEFAGRLLPVTALLLAPWVITFQRILARELRQDRRLDSVASRAVQHSIHRSALREGARLPEFVEPAGRLAGITRSVLIGLCEDGSLEQVSAHDASLDDLVVSPAKLAPQLRKLRGRHVGRDATQLVPSWNTEARITWIGGAEQDLFWLFAEPPGGRTGKQGHLVRAISASFRELFRWRADLNARERQEERFMPIDERVASAISLVSTESDQIRRGFDTIETAVMVFHLIGSPLHANAGMEDIYREAELAVADTSLAELLAALTELDPVRIEAMLQDLVFNGGEMRVPMRRFGPSQRVLRVAAPGSMARGADRVIVVEAIDISELHSAADLRKAVAMFIDLQLRNDLEAILLAADLAKDPRVGPERIVSVVDRIGEAARRATGRLDEVAGLVRGETRDLVDASYPVDARKIVVEALEKTAELAEELGVLMDVAMPALSGFTIAEPRALADMLEAMLRVVIADTPQGETVSLRLEEQDARSHVRISGGFGVGFGRLVWLLTKSEDQSVGEYRLINRGIARTAKWGGSVSYWGREADGFGFNVNLRRIG